ncbi:hypothetical protein MPH_01948 [Macrophomina phaseolina MS6]|uniref:Transmembrane protein n=1 Tax=Macrophomina phaseolina (strain MS6) TaxID=1126212 RepID=K2RE23_MACPH|nr:hypothetical protein MPH_01948 [Macrophomina phaseolina MS6]
MRKRAFDRDGMAFSWWFFPFLPSNGYLEVRGSDSSLYFFSFFFYFRNGGNERVALADASIDSPALLSLLVSFSFSILLCLALFLLFLCFSHSSKSKGARWIFSAPSPLHRRPAISALPFSPPRSFPRRFRLTPRPSNAHATANSTTASHSHTEGLSWTDPHLSTPPTESSPPAVPRTAKLMPSLAVTAPGREREKKKERKQCFTRSLRNTRARNLRWRDGRQLPEKSDSGSYRAGTARRRNVGKACKGCGSALRWF